MQLNFVVRSLGSFFGCGNSSTDSLLSQWRHQRASAREEANLFSGTFGIDGSRPNSKWNFKNDANLFTRIDSSIALFTLKICCCSDVALQIWGKTTCAHTHSSSESTTGELAEITNNEIKNNIEFPFSVRFSICTATNGKRCQSIARSAVPSH